MRRTPIQIFQKETSPDTYYLAQARQDAMGNEYWQQLIDARPHYLADCYGEFTPAVENPEQQTKIFSATLWRF